MKQEMVDLAVVGAGPMGIEAALYARQLGLSVVVLEQTKAGATAAHACKQIAMFSPWQSSFSPLGIDVLRAHGGFTPPSEPMTWSDYLSTYLEPVARFSDLEICYETRVIGIARSEISRTDLIGNNRQTFPFRLLLSDSEGLETVLLANRVIDTSGVRDRPLWIGEGRLPAINERALRGRILPGASNLAERVNGETSRTWLVIGDDYEAAVAVHQIRNFIVAEPNARLVFIDEQGRQPYIKNLHGDVFPRRVDLVQTANDFILSGHPSVELHIQTVIERLDIDQGRIRVGIRGAEGESLLLVDHIVSAVGFAAPESLWEELQIHQCYASGAPMATAAAMLDDTMSFRYTPYVYGSDSLKNPEPGFYVLGSKSYGRNRGFSLHVGLGQIVAAFRDITGDQSLNLYTAINESLIPSDIVYLKPAQTPPPIPEERLSDREQKYKTIADNLQEVVFQTDLKQLITYLSPSWRTLTGKDPAGFIGLHWQTLLSDETCNQGLNACNAFMTQQMTDYHEVLSVRHVNGGERWVEVRASLLIDFNSVTYGTIGSMVDITDRIMAQQALEESNRMLDRLSMTDSLTGLFNRRYFDRELEREVRRSLRDAVPLTLTLIDIDHFKNYNDTYGHQHGDRTLKNVARSLQESCKRVTDLVCRYGGEEFVILLPGTDKVKASDLLETLRLDILRLHIEHQSSLVADKITISIGVSILDDFDIQPSVSPEIFLKQADDALYESKRLGRNRVTFCVNGK